MHTVNPTYLSLRWPKQKKRTPIEGRAGAAADFRGDEEKESAFDRQQLDSSAQQQFSQRCSFYVHKKVSPVLFPPSLASFNLHFFSPLVLLCRYESLDNLDVLRQSPDPSPTLTYPRSNSATGSYCTPTRAASSRYSTGSVPPGRNAYVEHGRYLLGVIFPSLSTCHVHSVLPMITCAAPGHSVPGGLAVCVSVSWVVVQPWS